MFIEASAQASSVFDISTNKPKIGFLTATKDIQLLNTLDKLSYIINLKETISFNSMKQFSFEALEQISSIKVVSGSFTILIQG
jgi:hypothetical protein